MKKIICLIISFSMLILCGCSSDTDDRRELTIAGCGTVKIPATWNAFEKDGIVYVTENDTPIMITTKCSGEKESNMYYKDYIYVDFISSAVLSNGVIYGKCKCIYNDRTVELYYLDLNSNVCFLVWNQSIDKDTIVKIAKTFAEEQ